MTLDSSDGFGSMFDLTGERTVSDGQAGLDASAVTPDIALSDFDPTVADTEPDAGDESDPDGADTVFALGQGSDDLSGSDDGAYGSGDPSTSDIDLAGGAALHDDDGGPSLTEPPPDVSADDLHQAQQDLLTQQHIQSGMNHMYDSIFPDHTPF